MVIRRTKLYIAASCSVMTASCSEEIGYIAKFCVGYDTVLYIDNDLNTFVSSGSLSPAEVALDDVEAGKINKRDMGAHFEYTGDLQFVAPKKNFAGNSIEGYSIEYFDDGYIVDGFSGNGNMTKFLINFEGELYQINEFVESQGSNTTVVEWKICDGRFLVN